MSASHHANQWDVYSLNGIVPRWRGVGIPWRYWLLGKLFGRMILVIAISRIILAVAISRRWSAIWIGHRVSRNATKMIRWKEVEKQ